MTIYISQQFLFRFEVDTLEIVLQELVGVVDTFFLIESDRTHQGVRRGEERRGGSEGCC